MLFMAPPVMISILYRMFYIRKRDHSQVKNKKGAAFWLRLIISVVDPAHLSGKNPPAQPLQRWKFTFGIREADIQSTGKHNSGHHITTLKMRQSTIGIHINSPSATDQSFPRMALACRKASSSTCRITCNRSSDSFVSNTSKA